MKVFSKAKFVKVEGYGAYLESQKWVDECDGKPVRDGLCGVYCADDEWCIEAPDVVEESARKPIEVSPKGYSLDAAQAVNCRCSDVSMHPRYKIVIEGYKNTTLATMYVDDKVIKRTAAKRHPADKYNWKIGAQTAFNRLWEKKKKPVKPVDKYVQLFNEKLTEFAKAEAEKIFRRFDKLPPAVREVRRRAKPGEWVKIIEATNDQVNDYKNGDVLLIVPYNGDTCEEFAHYKDEDTKFLYDKEYLVLEGYKPE